MQLENHSELEQVTIFFEGKPYKVEAGITVAAALIGYTDFQHTCRNSVSGEKRAPYCMMGVCFECMVEIDGQANQQSCLRNVEDQMKIRRQDRVREEL